METKIPVEIADSARLAPITFDSIGVKIRRGTVIGTYDADVLGLSPCFGGGGNIFWNQGRVRAKDIEFADLFYSELKSARFNVLGDPDKMFAGASDDRRNPTYLVGGQIDEIKLNVCQEKNFWTGFPLGIQNGKGAVRVKWQMFSLLERKVVFEATTQGAATLDTGVGDGELVLIQDAFANAVVNLAANEKFVEILSERNPSIADIKNIDDTRLEIDRYAERHNSITEEIDLTRQSVVTIDLGVGHGSGFFIAPTLIMTNFHVVENQKLVRVVLLTGRRIVGEVVRRHPKRDVAIIQVEAGGYIPIPIRMTPLRITEEVYAIGSPLDKSLSGTVTKGIVSKFISNASGMEDIQADVDIQGGNSGGVLLDAKGNIVGITYAGIAKHSVGLNFFIPIMDALTKLNIGFRN